MLNWFSISAIAKEVKRIRWPKQKEMISDSFTVITFTVGFGIFFVICEIVVAAFLRMIGIGV